MITKQNILELSKELKPNSRFVIRSKRAPMLKWYGIEVVFDEIKRNRIIIKATQQLLSERFNPTMMMITQLMDFESDYPIYIYLKDKVVTLPAIDVKRIGDNIELIIE